MSLFDSNLIKNEKDIELLKIMKLFLKTANEIQAKGKNYCASYVVTGAPVIKELNKVFILHPEL